jgi:hypothetical protein
VSEEFLCWQRFGSDVAHSGPSTQEPEARSIGWGQGTDHAAESSAQANGHGWQWLKDPRLDILGYRGIFPADTIRKLSMLSNIHLIWCSISNNVHLNALLLAFSAAPLVEADKEADERHYLLWRIENGVAEGSAEIPKGRIHVKTLKHWYPFFLFFHTKLK